MILKEYNPKIAYITISPSRAKEFQALYETRKKINVIPNGIDPADWVTIRDLCQISDLLFLPSKREGFGIPLLEAGMAKLPIACSDIEPFKSIAGENVFYFPLKDSPEKIAENILEFLGQLQTHRMYRKIFRYYLWDNIYNDLLRPFLEKV